MAGVPMKAAAVLKKMWKENPTAEDWGRLVNTYLSGYRYKMALASAKSALGVKETAEQLWGPSPFACKISGKATMPIVGAPT